MEQHQVTTNEQLNDLGYFNAENLVVTRNFYFDGKSMTWTYQPGELAVVAIGEPAITLDLDVLRPYACDNSVIKYFK